jgi:hypothetical protein
MVWRNEKWLAEVFPGNDHVYSKYRQLQPRELSIVAAAVLDSALAELLSLRLVDKPVEMEAYLGVNGDGRAPAGSFGVRIQLAFLVGLLTEQDCTILRRIKDLRNHFAHRVNVDFLSPQVVKTTVILCDAWERRLVELSDAGVLQIDVEKVTGLKQSLPTLPEAGEGLLLAVLAVYQAYFHRMHGKVRRITSAEALVNMAQTAAVKT